MSSTQNSSLGPVRLGTLVSRDGQAVVASYLHHLDLSVAVEGEVGSALAELWCAPELSGNRYWLLANQLGESWLRVVEDKAAETLAPLRHTGWLSLEVSVSDVDALSDALQESSFKTLRPPANLDVSDDIRAMQVSGVAGEVLYLTQVFRDVPPFELPQARCPVDKLFIPVLCCHDRDESLAFYERIANASGQRFETKITVINNEYGYPIDERHPVATLQLTGKTLIEIDSVAAAQPRERQEGHLPPGIAMISFEVDDLDVALAGLKPAGIVSADEPPYFGRRAACVEGPAGELVELIERT